MNKLKLILFTLLCFTITCGAAMPDTPDMKYKWEWLGESGYCNCLLTTMCRIPISKVIIKSNEQVPNLEILAKHKIETLNWLKAQEFNYKSLDTKKVLDILAESAGMSFSLFGNKKAVLKAYVVDNEGNQILRLYSFEIKKENKQFIMQIMLQER